MLNDRQERNKNRIKSAGTWIWTRFKNRNAKEKLEATVKTIVAASVAGGLALGTIGYVRANDAQNTIKNNEAAWLSDLQGAQQAAQVAQENAAAAQATASEAQERAATAQSVAATAQQAAKDAESKANVATDKATAAQSTAAQAQSVAAAAQAKAEETKQVAAAAQETANVAKESAASTQSFAEETQNELNVLIQQFNDGQAVTQTQIDDARARAIAAQASADAAQAAADTSQTSANGAKAAADSAQAVADKAVADALAAKSAADAAQATADAAGSDAAAAQAAADAAQIAADAAQATADNALAIAQQALADAASAQATADNALAVAQQALAGAIVRTTTQFPDQPIPDNVGTFDDGPAGTLVVQPGVYVIEFGATLPNYGYQMQLNVPGVANYNYGGCITTSGQRVRTTPAIAISVPTTVQLFFDSCGPNQVHTIDDPYIRVHKLV
jgi:hypothetical protein